MSYKVFCFVCLKLMELFERALHSSIVEKVFNSWLQNIHLFSPTDRWGRYPPPPDPNPARHICKLSSGVSRQYILAPYWSIWFTRWVGQRETKWHPKCYLSLVSQATRNDKRSHLWTLPLSVCRIKTSHNTHC